MTRDLLASDNTAVQLGPSRGRVLTAAGSSATGMSVHEVAELVGLHPNTVRFHLEELVEHGMCTRAIEHRAQPGRPRVLYTVTNQAVIGERKYRLLAEMLVDIVTIRSADPGATATATGRTWGRLFAVDPQSPRDTDADQSMRTIMRKLEDLGFAPTQPTSGRLQEVRMHHCPFLEIARTNQTVVCGLHLGLLRGMLDEIQAPLQATTMTPFAEPGVCIARLAQLTRRRSATHPHDEAGQDAG